MRRINDIKHILRKLVIESALMIVGQDMQYKAHIKNAKKLL